MIAITPAAAADLAEIEALLDLGFGPARHNRTAYRLREGTTPDAGLSFVARDGDRLVGSVQCWPIRLSGAAVALPLTLLGPLVVAGDRQGEGIASRLVRTALAAADALGAPPVLLIGDLGFYARFGFANAATGGWQLPGPFARERLLLRGDSRGLPSQGRVAAATQGRRAA